MRKRAFTLIELLVVMAIIALLLSILLPALAKARATARQVKDATQMAQVHKGWLIFARESNGNLPTPGLINRLSVDGAEIPGRGEEDQLKNTTAAVHSVSIMNNYYSQQLVVSPSEPNGHVVEDNNYDFTKFNAAADIYWDGDETGEGNVDDTGFKSDLETECNTSYASMPLCGMRKSQQWAKESLDSKFAVLGNRGVEDGSLDPDDYTQSLTIEIHGGAKRWLGNVCYNDNHVQLAEGFTPEGIDYLQDETLNPDNLFNNDTGTTGECDGYDCWLVIVSEIDGSQDALEFTVVWD